MSQALNKDLFRASFRENAMQLNDKWGNPVSNANPSALERYEQAADLFLGYSGRAAETIDAALASTPDFVMGQCFKAATLAIANEKAFAPQLAETVNAAAALADRANERERRHIGAACAWLDGDLPHAARIYDELAIDYPRDTVALQLAHALDFYLGQSTMLRDRIARVLPAWSENVPGYSYVLGMQAFGFEETGDYARAESAGREAVERDARDVWAIHAVAHVMEMQGRMRDGIQWLHERESGWGAPDNLFAIHNAWHLALFHLELGEHAEALRVYDARIRAGASTVALDLVDATALLWRLRLRGADVGTRWREIADCWAAADASGWYAFNDMHAMMSFVADGRTADADALLAALAGRARDSDPNAIMTREVGLPACRAIAAFERGDYATAIDILEPLRLIAHRFGGSHAQRDVIALTLIEAALRGRSRNLARALAAERLAAKPASPFNRELAARAQAV
jgi:tetratricopeptide (TPR) repeat protein